MRIGKESSYGTLASNLNTHIRIISESLKYNPGLTYHRTVEGGRLLQTKQLGKANVTGSIDLYPVYDKGLGELLLACFGTATSSLVSGSTTTYRHVFTPKMSIKDSPWPSYSLEVGLDDVVAKQILGAVVESLAFDVEAGDFLGVTAEVYAAREQKAPLYTGTLEYSTLNYIHSADVATQTIDGSEVKLEMFSLEVKNNFPEGYKFGSRYPQEIDVGPLEVSGELAIRFLTDTHFDDFLSSSEQSLVLKFEGPETESGYRYQLQFELPRIVYDAGDANINEQDRLVQNISFTALEHSSEGLIKITLQNKQPSY